MSKIKDPANMFSNLPWHNTAPGRGKSDFTKKVAKKQGWKIKKLKLPKYKHRTDGDMLGFQHPHINVEPDVASWLEWAKTTKWKGYADIDPGETPWHRNRAVTTPEGCVCYHGQIINPFKWRSVL